VRPSCDQHVLGVAGEGVAFTMTGSLMWDDADIGNKVFFSSTDILSQAMLVNESSPSRFPGAPHQTNCISNGDHVMLATSVII